jgi:hypothetical protein
VAPVSMFQRYDAEQVRTFTRVASHG